MFWLVNVAHWFFVVADRYEVFTTPALMDKGMASSQEASFWSTFSRDFAHVHGPFYDGKIFDWKLATSGISLLFFFIVFYNNNTYSRFFTLYGHTVGLAGGLMEWTAIVKSNCPDNKMAQWNAVRYMLASMHILYYSLNEKEQKLTDAFWDVISARQLLSKDEIKSLKDYKGFRPFLAIYWALEEAKAQMQSNKKGEDMTESIRVGLQLSQLRDAAFGFRGHCGQIVNLLKQPVPFPYFHLLNVMLMINLIALAYGIVSLAWFPYTVLMMALISIVLIGMRSLAVQLSDPFGDDLVDFELEKFLWAAYTNAIAHLREPKNMLHRESLPTGLKCPLYEQGEHASALDKWEEMEASKDRPARALPPPKGPPML
jgi:predicted membrane chloride channel (bestrophin family)